MNLSRTPTQSDKTRAQRNKNNSKQPSPFRMMVRASMVSVVAFLGVTGCQADLASALCGGTTCEVVEFGADGDTFPYNGTEQDQMVELRINETASYSLIAGRDLGPASLPFLTVQLKDTDDQITCAGSKAVAIGTHKAVPRTEVFESELELSADGSYCVAKWYDVFESTAQLNEFRYQVYLLLAEVTADPFEGEVFVNVQEAPAIITKQMIETPAFSVSTFLAVDKGNNKFGIDLVLSKQSTTALDCGSPSNLRVIFLDGNGDYKPGCEKPFRRRGSVQLDRYEYEFSEPTVLLDNNFVSKCHSHFDVIGSDNVYTMTMQLENVDICNDIPLGAPPKPLFPPAQGDQTFFVRMKREDVVTTDPQGASQMLFKYVDHSFEACAPSLLPMAHVTLEAEAYALVINEDVKEVQPEFAAMATLDNMVLELSPGFDKQRDCGWEGATYPRMYKCKVSYVSAGCLPMNVREGNNGTECAFPRAAAINVAGTFIYQDALLNMIARETASIQETPVLPPATFQSPDCPEALEQTDVSGEYPLSLDLEGTMLRNIMGAKVALGGNQQDTTVRIVMVQVEMEGNYLMFTPDKKLDRMSLSTAPEFTDAHFCRYSTPNQDPSDSTCVPFYVSGVRSNSAMDRGLVANRGFDRCQLNDERKEDNFFFTPANWVVGQFDGLNTTLTVTVHTIVDTCDTPMTSSLGRRRLQGASRSGQTTEGVKVSSATTTITLEVASQQEATPDNTVGGGGFAATSNAGVIAGGVVGSIAVIAAAVAFVIVRRKQLDAEVASESTVVKTSEV